MKTKLFQISCLAIFIVLITGCTHKISVPLMPDYQKDVNLTQELVLLRPSLQFVKGEFSDKRVDVTKLASFKQQVHTFDLYAKRPVEEAIFDGLAVLLKKTGHTWSDNGAGQVKINFQLLSVTASRNAGMIMVGATSSIQIKLDFIDNSTGNLIYSQIYNGNDDRAQAMLGLMEMVIKSIDASIINCINNVANDKMLVQTLKKIEVKN